MRGGVGGTKLLVGSPSPGWFGGGRFGACRAGRAGVVQCNLRRRRGGTRGARGAPSSGGCIPLKCSRGGQRGAVPSPAIHTSPLSLSLCSCFISRLHAVSPVLQVLGTGWRLRMDPLFPAHILEDPDLRKLLNDSSMLNLSFLPTNWFNNSTGDSFLPLSIKITIVVVYSIVCIVGLVGNCSVMYVIVRLSQVSGWRLNLCYKGTGTFLLIRLPVSSSWGRVHGREKGSHQHRGDWQCSSATSGFTKMKTATNIYIFNLALADTLCLMTLPFQGTDTFLGFWPFGNVLCKIAISIDYYNMFTSTFTLTMMSVDRYIAICHPIKALDIRTPHKAKVVNVCIWALASVFGIPAMVMGSAENENNEIDCLIKLPSPVDYWDPVFGICVFLFSFMIPVLIITICYSLMIRRLKNVRVLSGSKEKDRNLRRITRMVLVVVAVFIICWTPIQIFVLVQCLGAKAESELELAISCFCTALGYANSSLNPVLYAFLDENFKACFKKFCFPSAFRTELQMSNRMCSIAKDVAYACKNSEGTNNPA
uniref:Opioid related nociceptin receptor 1 n=2 Tax=Anatidae TaxID=8830 RepID=A0A8C3C3J0_CAIMO